MAELPQGWRVVVIANVMPIAEALIAQLEEMGHDVVAWMMQRRHRPRELPPPLWEETTMFETGPRMIPAALALLPQVFERLAAGDPGDPQGTEGATWGGMLGEDYATIDWSTQTAREIHNQVRAWTYSFGMGPVPGP